MIRQLCKSQSKVITLRNAQSILRGPVVLQPATRAYSSHVPWSHESKDLELQRLTQCYFESDTLAREPTQLLDSALEDYLPRKRLSPMNPAWMQIGYQHAYFRPRLRYRELCDDGTDIKFLPGPADIWKYRLWAGGSVHVNSKCKSNSWLLPYASLSERASNVRVVEADGQPKKVFVTIERQFNTSDKPGHAIKASVVGHAGEDYAFTSDSHYMIETENICFLRDPPASFQDKRKIKPPSNPVFTHTMTPTRSLLFQFSALTYNAHSIHVDREFARDIYGAEDLVVHGPLTQVLMVEFLSRYLGSLVPDKASFPVPWYIRYTNLQPLYVDRPLTLCCKPISITSGTEAGKADSWQVWIQTGEGEEASCAVKATVNVKHQAS